MESKGMPRRMLSREFMVEVVRQFVENGRSVSEVADGLGINRYMLTRLESELGAEGAEAFPRHGKLTAIDEALRVHRRKPGSLHHLAFKADSREQVDALHAELLRIGATIVSGPQLHPEYSPDYYAVFWKDPDGIKFELVCNEAVSS